jgi:hypothetical protein
VFEQAVVRGLHWYHRLCSPDYLRSAEDYWAARPAQIPIHAHLVDNWASGVHDFRVYYFFSNLVDPSESEQYQESTLAVVPLRVSKVMLREKQYPEAMELLATQLESLGFTVYRNFHKNQPWDNWRFEDLEGKESTYPPVLAARGGAETAVVADAEGRLHCASCGATLGKLRMT